MHYYYTPLFCSHRLLLNIRYIYIYIYLSVFLLTTINYIIFIIPFICRIIKLTEYSQYINIIEEIIIYTLIPNKPALHILGTQSIHLYTYDVSLL